MRIDKFLEKISQDERVEKVEHEKRQGYIVKLKKGYGILNNSTNTRFVGNGYIDFSCVKIQSWIHETSQDNVEWFLTKVEKYNEELIATKNKKSELISLKRFFENTKSAIRRVENEIQNKIKTKESYNKQKSEIETVIKELEKEVEVYGTAEQL